MRYIQKVDTIRTIKPKLINEIHLIVLEGNDMYEHLHTYKHTHRLLYRNTFIHSYTHIHPHLHSFIHTHPHSFIHTHPHSFIHTLIHTYTHTHSCIHVHTYTHSHMYVPLVLGEQPLIPLRVLGMRLMLLCGVLKTKKKHNSI